MKLRRTVLVALLSLAPGPASALASGDINIAWLDCAVPYGSGLTDLHYACDGNNGYSLLVASFSPPVALSQLNGTNAVVDFQSSAATLSPWWQLQPGGCREGSLTASFDFTAGPTSCEDVWLGQAVGTFRVDQSGTNRLRLRAMCAFAVGSERVVNDDGTEYDAFLIRIQHAKTVGDGSCSGCLDPVCIVFNSLMLTQPSGVGDYALTTGPNQFAGWRGGAYQPCGAGGSCVPIPCPVIKSTWGRVKSRFR